MRYVVDYSVPTVLFGLGHALSAQKESDTHEKGKFFYLK